MSYILDALKQSDRKRRQGQADLETVHVEPELSPASFSLRTLLIIIILLGNFVFASLWIYESLSRPEPESSSSEQSQQTIGQSSVTPSVRSVTPEPASSADFGSPIDWAPVPAPSPFGAGDITENLLAQDPNLQSSDQIRNYLARVQALKQRLSEEHDDAARAESALKLQQAELALLTLLAQQKNAELLSERSSEAAAPSVASAAVQPQPQPRVQPQPQPRPQPEQPQLISPGGQARAYDQAAARDQGQLIQPNRPINNSPQNSSAFDPNRQIGLVEQRQIIEPSPPASSSAYDDLSKPGTRVIKGWDNLPLIQQLPEVVRVALPPMQFNSHTYTTDPRFRTVMINGRSLSENDHVDYRTRVVRISEQGVVLQFDEVQFKVNLLEDWSE